MRKRLLQFAFLALCPLLAAQQAMNNDAVLKLVKAGLSEDIIITTINSSPGTYDTSANGLIALKQGGASDKVISAIVMKTSGTNHHGGAQSDSQMGTNGLPSGIDEAGVYYSTPEGTWKPVPTELASIAFSKAKLWTMGLAGKGNPAKLSGPHSKLSLALPVELAVYVTEDAGIAEYKLFRMHPKENERSFTIVNGSASPDDVPFKSEKIAPRVYKVRLEKGLGEGEYGLLPPSSYGGMKLDEMHSSGKAYAFTLTE